MRSLANPARNIFKIDLWKVVCTAMKYAFFIFIDEYDKRLIFAVYTYPPKRVGNIKKYFLFTCNEVRGVT